MGPGGAGISVVERGRVGKEGEGGSEMGFSKVGDERVCGVRR